MNKSGLFLRCNNLTLDQYKLITFSSGLTGAVGFTVSVVVLVVILLAARRRAWDTFLKRFFFMVILYTAAYCVVAATGVHYSRPPDQESKWCEAMGFLNHYSGSLVFASYIVGTTALALQVVMPVCPALQRRVERTFKNRKLWEVIPFLGCFLFPALITWEPFIAPFASYGNYGPICWFRLVIDENCTYKNIISFSKDVYFLWTLPFAIMSFVMGALILVITIVLCFMYCKFHKTKVGQYIKKAIGQALILTVASFVWVASFSQMLLQSIIKPSKTFSSWIVNDTITQVTMAGAVVLVALYIHLPVQWLYSCCKIKRRTPKHKRLQSHAITERPTVRSSQWDHRNVPSFTVTNIRHETVTGSETIQLIDEQLNYQTLTDPVA